jgi:hypothetical protein
MTERENDSILNGSRSARRRNGRPHASSDHALRRARLQPGVGYHRCRRVSDDALQPTGAQRRAAARGARGRPYRRGASHHRGCVAAPAGVGLTTGPAGIDAAKIVAIARARASAADKARWVWRNQPSQCCSCAVMRSDVAPGFDRGQRASRWSPSVRRWSALRSLWEAESRPGAEDRRQRGKVAGLAGLASPGLRSAASTENVTYAVHPSSRFLASNS